MKDKDMEKLVFGMAHQIRNPCAIILANANLLLKTARSPNERQSLEAIVKGVRYLEARLDEFVEFSKPLLFKFEEFSLSSLCEEMKIILKDRCQLQRATISCTVEEPLIIKADHQQLLLAFLNILMNAIESNENGAQVRLEAKKSSDSVVCVIRDNGIGIHPRDLPEVFSPFYSTKEGAIGIGLPVSKRIIEAHGGEISVASESGKGTIVTVRLPTHPSVPTAKSHG